MALEPRYVPRKTPRQARAQATVEALLEATARVLVTEGWEGTTTNRIAEVAGVAVGSLYQYFPNKEAMIAMLLDRHEEEMRALLVEMTGELAEAPLEEAVRAYVGTMIRLHALEPALHKALTAEVARVWGFDRLFEVQRLAESIVQGYLEGHRPRLRPDNLQTAAFILVSSVEAVTHFAVLHRPEILGDPAFPDEVTELVLGYLLHERGRSPRPRRRSKSEA